MNYEESRAYIRAAELKKGIVLGLENMRELSEAAWRLPRMN